ncbi:MAG: septum formation initiator family protein [Opitutaceae bacterium]
MNRVITTLYIVVFVGFGLTACFLFIDARAEYDRLRQMEAGNRQRLAEAQTRLQEQERILERLRTDPAYVEKVIFRRWGYAKPDQVIFDFRNEARAP